MNQMLCKTVAGVLPNHFIITSGVLYTYYLILALHYTTPHLQVPYSKNKSDK